MRVVASVEVTAEHPTEVFADDLLDHGPTAGVMVLIVANGWGRSCPDIAILSVFSPPRLIHLDGRAGSDLCFEHIQMRLHLFFQAMLQFNNLSIADRDGMQRTQVGLDLSNGQTHHQAQGRNQASQPDSDAPLTHNLFLQIHWGFMPFLTVGCKCLNSNGGICTIILVNISFLPLVRLLLTRLYKPGKPDASLKRHLCVRQNNCTDSTIKAFVFTL